jgi:hypothetical protein
MYPIREGWEDSIDGPDSSEGKAPRYPLAIIIIYP